MEDTTGEATDASGPSSRNEDKGDEDDDEVDAEEWDIEEELGEVVEDDCVVCGRSAGADCEPCIDECCDDGRGLDHAADSGDASYASSSDRGECDDADE